MHPWGRPPSAALDLAGKDQLLYLSDDSDFTLHKIHLQGAAC